MRKARERSSDRDRLHVDQPAHLAGENVEMARAVARGEVDDNGSVRFLVRAPQGPEHEPTPLDQTENTDEGPLGGLKLISNCMFTRSFRSSARSSCWEGPAATHSPSD